MLRKLPPKLQCRERQKLPIASPKVLQELSADVRRHALWRCITYYVLFRCCHHLTNPNGVSNSPIIDTEQTAISRPFDSSFFALRATETTKGQRFDLLPKTMCRKSCVAKKASMSQNIWERHLYVTYARLTTCFDSSCRSVVLFINIPAGWSSQFRIYSTRPKLMPFSQR